MFARPDLNEVYEYAERFHMFIAQTAEARRCIRQAYQQNRSPKQSPGSNTNIYEMFISDAYRIFFRIQLATIHCYTNVSPAIIRHSFLNLLMSHYCAHLSLLYKNIVTIDNEVI